VEIMENSRLKSNKQAETRAGHGIKEIFTFVNDPAKCLTFDLKRMHKKNLKVDEQSNKTFQVHLKNIIISKQSSRNFSRFKNYSESKSFQKVVCVNYC